MSEWHPPRKKEGDSVTTAGRRPPEKPSLDVLYCSESYVVINKPADVRMDGNFDVTIEKLVRAELERRTSAGLVVLSADAKIRFVHQLDYATSGVLLLALSRPGAAFACRQFERRTVRKTYLALVYGSVPAGSHLYDDAIADDVADSFKMTVGTATNPGRHAETICTPLAYGTFLGQDITKVQLQPSSGRRHQLRVHLLQAGFPIVGDATYARDSDKGPSDPNTPPRMMLHAWRLVVELPSPVGFQQFETSDPFEAYLTNAREEDLNPAVPRSSSSSTTTSPSSLVQTR